MERFDPLRRLGASRALAESCGNLLKSLVRRRIYGRRIRLRLRIVSDRSPGGDERQPENQKYENDPRHA
jgi:hypothetical protein